MSDLILIVDPTDAEEVRQTLLGLQNEYVTTLGGVVLQTSLDETNEQVLLDALQRASAQKSDAAPSA